MFRDQEARPAASPSRAETVLQVLGRMVVLLLLALALNAVQAFVVIPVAQRLPQLGDAPSNLPITLMVLTHVLALWLVTPALVDVSWQKRLLLASMGVIGFYGVVAYAILVPLIWLRQQRAAAMPA